MLSTLLNYRYYATNITKSLDRVQQSGTVASDTKYYQDNIGKVTDVDDFLGDYRLYTYALKAYGLEDQAASKGFVRKVLESDLTDSKSFANALADERYRDFAQAFNFKTDATTETAQSTRQNEALIEAYSEHRVRQGTSLATKTNYFQDAVASVTSVDDFLNNTVLYDVALQSIGADPAFTSKSYVRDVFLGKVSDNASSSSDDKFFALADKFDFSADGTVPSGQRALSTAATSQLIHDFNVKTGNTASSQSAAHETAYYSQQIGLVDDADDLVNDQRLFDYVRTAFGLDDTTQPAFIRNILVSDPADPTSALNTLSASTTAAQKERLVALNAAFNFTPTGSVPAGETAQAGTAQDALIDRYYNNYQTAANKDEASKTSTFKLLLGKINSVTDLLAKDAVFGRDGIDYVLEAFDLDPATESLTKIRRVLESDTSDPNSYVNKLGDERYEKLAAAFNFDQNGKLRAERVVQSSADQTQTGTRYIASFGTGLSDAKKDVLTTETKAYITAVSGVRTIDDLLKNDTILNYALTAYGLKDQKLSTTDLRKILTSDLSDKSSFANAKNDKRYTDLAGAFNFDAKGLVKLADAGVQSPGDQLSTENNYLLTTLEQQAGDTSEGTRLALYFLRKAPDLTSTLKLLADSAVVEVVKTALSLPDSISQLDIDKQVSIIAKRLDVKDLQDPKKLDKFISRFAALYDLKNADTSQSSPLLGLFSGDSTGSGLLAVL